MAKVLIVAEHDGSARFTDLSRRDRLLGRHWRESIAIGR